MKLHINNVVRSILSKVPQELSRLRIKFLFPVMASIVQDEVESIKLALLRYGGNKAAKNIHIYESVLRFAYPFLQVSERGKWKEIIRAEEVAKIFIQIVCEEKLPEEELKIGVVACLLYNIGWSSPRIDRSDLQSDKNRKIHMEDGAKMTEKILNHIAKIQPDSFTQSEIQRIVEIIRHHDDPSLGICLDPEDRLAIMQREAARLWKLTEVGFRDDLELDWMRKNHFRTPTWRLNHNLKRYKEEAELYKNKPGFINGTPFRTQTAYNLLLKLLLQREKEYGIIAFQHRKLHEEALAKFRYLSIGCPSIRVVKPENDQGALK